jgi:hypothetical protein
MVHVYVTEATSKARHDKQRCGHTVMCSLAIHSCSVTLPSTIHKDIGAAASAYVIYIALATATKRNIVGYTVQQNQNE